jgi:CheY-like chemotaxis protein
MSHTLLLADDSVTIQRVIELTFADEDIQVIAVGDGQRTSSRRIRRWRTYRSC